MPLCLDPDATFDVWLESDAHRDQAARPALTFRAMTARAWREFDAVAAAVSATDATLDAPALLDKLFAALAAHVSRRNLPMDAPLDDILTIDEAWELYYRARGKARLGARAKNASDSPSSSSGAAAEATPSAAQAADAPPPPTSPPSSSAPNAPDSAATNAAATAKSASPPAP